MRSASPVCVTFRRCAAKSNSSVATASTPANAIRIRFSSDGQSILGMTKTLEKVFGRSTDTASCEMFELTGFGVQLLEQPLF